MKIYTKKGDRGETGLFGGSRVSKSHARVEAYGVVDELNALLGLARAESLPEEIDRVLGRLQEELLELGAGLAAPDPAKQAAQPVSDSHIGRIEDDIDRFEKDLAPLRHFILPGGGRAAATLHVARVVCRRAERRVVSLRDRRDEHVPDGAIPFLNRLGDLLFVLARAANANEQVDDVIWRNVKDEKA
jgi:cob(I)alamin adenosyltransferase